MTKPINLNKARKARAKADKVARAERNSVAFGRTKAEKSLDRARSEKAARNPHGHRRNE